ncbi:MAG: hypothetical protein ACLSCU_02310 [Eubacterium sp.]
MSNIYSRAFPQSVWWTKRRLAETKTEENKGTTAADQTTIKTPAAPQKTTAKAKLH